MPTKQESFGLSTAELRVFQKLKSPQKIQDFLGTIPHNFERRGATCLSPASVLKKRCANCIEGAMLAATALRLQGRKPLVMDLQSSDRDVDHVVALFKEDGHWGCISKTNHGVLRYRDAVYTSIRELAMSFFHEYFLDDGSKTLRSYTDPIDLSKLDTKNWMSSKDDVWFVPEYINNCPHYALMDGKQIKALRKADRIERDNAKKKEWSQKWR